MSLEEYTRESQVKKGREAHFLQREKLGSRYMVRGGAAGSRQMVPKGGGESLSEDVLAARLD